MDIKDIKTCTSESDLDYIIDKEHKLNSVLQTALLYIKNNHSNMDSTVLAVVYDKICKATDDKLPEDSKINDKTTLSDRKSYHVVPDDDSDKTTLLTNIFHIDDSSDFRKLCLNELVLTFINLGNSKKQWKNCLSGFDIKSDFKSAKQLQSAIRHRRNVHNIIYAICSVVFMSMVFLLPNTFWESFFEGCTGIGFMFCILYCSLVTTTNLANDIYYSNKPATATDLINAIKLVKKQNYNIIHTCYSRKQDLNHIELKRMRDNQTPLDHIKAIDNGDNSWDKIAKQVSNSKVHDEESEHEDECMAK